MGLHCSCSVTSFATSVSRADRLLKTISSFHNIGQRWGGGNFPGRRFLFLDDKLKEIEQTKKTRWLLFSLFVRLSSVTWPGPCSTLRSLSQSKPSSSIPPPKVESCRLLNRRDGPLSKHFTSLLRFITPGNELRSLWLFFIKIVLVLCLAQSILSLINVQLMTGMMAPTYIVGAIAIFIILVIQQSE